MDYLSFVFNNDFIKFLFILVSKYYYVSKYLPSISKRDIL